MMTIHKLLFLLMPLMPLILLIANKQLCITSPYCIHHSLPSCPSDCSLLKKASSLLLRALHGRTLLLWPCSYAIAVTPLINHLRQSQPDVSQVWYADDATAAGQLEPLLQWWKLVSSTCPHYGYFPNAIKTYLIVKPQYLDSATALFQGTNVQITCLGQQHLGAAISSRSFTEEYISKKVKLWCDEILTCLLLLRHIHTVPTLLLFMEFYTSRIM